MEKDNITMSMKQLNRFDVLSKANAGFITVREASEALGLSERQVKRLKKKVREEGAAGVIHKNTGRAPAGKTSEETKAEILRIHGLSEYEGANFRHFAEILSERHGIEMPYSSLYALLKGNGAKSPKTKRRHKTHRRRARRPQAGLLLQVDATPFAWFKGDRRRYALHGGIDDATGQVTGLYMCRNECLHGHFEMLRRTIEAFGIPKSVYADRHTIFQSPNAKKHEIDASVQANDTQFGRCLKELSATLVPARSPQAKGRVERLWETLQGRLPVEFAMNGITSMDEANAFLETYIFDFNARFAVEPENAQAAFGKMDGAESVDHILCVKEKRTVDAGGVFSYGGKSFKILDGHAPVPAKSRVDVLVGSRIGIMAAFGGRLFETLPFVPPKRARKPAAARFGKRPLPPPPPDHAWRTSLQTHIRTFDEYEADDAYHETIRMLEKTLLGKYR
jgi:transposase